MTTDAQVLALLIARTSRIHLSYEITKRLSEAFIERLRSVL
jgi:hypothetical protein